MASSAQAAPTIFKLENFIWQFFNFFLKKKDFRLSYKFEIKQHVWFLQNHNLHGELYFISIYRKE